MIALAVALPVFASFVGGLGYLFESGWMFWGGALLALISLSLDVRAGMYLAPTPALLGAMTLGALFLDTWYAGAALGLIAVTAIRTVSVLGKAARLS